MRRFYHVITCARLALAFLALISWSSGARADEDGGAPVEDAAALVDAAPAPGPLLVPPVIPNVPRLAPRAPIPTVPAPSEAVTPTPPPVVSAVPVPAAAPSSSAAIAGSNEIKVRDRVVYTVRARRAERPAADRAKSANAAIEALLSHPETLGEVHYEESQDAAVLYIGKTPILTLGPEDVVASGEANLDVLAAQVAARTGDAVASERQRSAIATTVFGVSLLVFSALIAFWLLGRAAELAGKLRKWMEDNPQAVTAIQLGKIELVSAGATRGGSSMALTLGYRFTQFAIAYAWVLFSLSLFETTRAYTGKLTGLIVLPIYALATRIGTALPVVVIAAIAILALTVLVRFVGLFFDSIARGDTRVGWLARDLARPTSVLVRVALVIMALVLASPLVTGESDGSLARVGMVALVTIGLASTPLLASAAVGVVVVYGRGVKRGELVELGGKSGRVVEIGLLGLRLEDAGASDVSVPHLLGLFHPLRVHRHPPLTTIDVVVDSSAPQAEVEKKLLEAARRISSRGRVELVWLDANGAHWRVHSASFRNDVTLGRAVQEALADLGVGLGRRERGPGTASS